MLFPRHLAVALLAGAQAARGIDLVINNTESTKAAAKIIAEELVSYYHGNEPGQIPGILPPPYYWWECGAMFNTLINYWYYTGDDSYNEIVKEGLIFQASPSLNFLPANQSKNEGNDDMDFWAYAAMSAAELNFDNPADDEPSWLGLAQGVFNFQAARWDEDNCNGGLRWQIYSTNLGYNYKNSPANGGHFMLGARLYAYTGNQSYADEAVKTWDWMTDPKNVQPAGLISPQYEVFDGAAIDLPTKSCPGVDHTRWTYNQGVLLYGAAVMWNMTNSTEWRERTQGLWNATAIFFNEQQVMFEVCELPGSTVCNLDQQSFKAYLSRFMAATTKVAPWLYDQVMPYLYSSAAAAALQCSGGTAGTTCGMKWTQNSTYDGASGVGEQMAALEVIQSTLIQKTSGPVSANTGGTSKSNPGAGTGDNTGQNIVFDTITTGDRAGAGILTAVLIVLTLSGAYWIST